MSERTLGTVFAFALLKVLAELGLVIGTLLLLEVATIIEVVVEATSSASAASSESTSASEATLVTVGIATADIGVVRSG